MYRRTLAALKMAAACALVLAFMGAMSTSTAAQTLCTNNSALAAVDTNGDGIATAGEMSALAPDNAELQAAVGQLQAQGYSGIQYTGCTPGDGGTGTGDGGTGDGGGTGTSGGTGDGGTETGDGSGVGDSAAGDATDSSGSASATGDSGSAEGVAMGGDGTGTTSSASIAGDSGSAEGAATGGGGSNTGAAQAASGESVVAFPSAGSGAMVAQGQPLLPIGLVALVLVSFAAFVAVQRRHAR